MRGTEMGWQRWEWETDVRRDMSSYGRERERSRRTRNDNAEAERLNEVCESSKNREYIHQVSPSGSQPCALSTPLSRGRLETQLAHGRDQISLLNRLGEIGREELLALRDLGSAVRADSNYWCRRVLIVGTFYIPCGAFTINCARSISRCQWEWSWFTYE